MTIGKTQVEVWLENWVAAIRSRDFEAGRRLFAADVVAFGSLSSIMVGREALVAEQWQKVWSATRGFTFGAPALFTVSDDLAVFAAEWRSEGVGDDGTYDRQGRATLVLQARPEGLVCVHSHVSMLPGSPPLTERA